jgi:peptide/nickel transport system ATP-binding protein/oligopeptide transport system ATP-binding protein
VTPAPLLAVEDLRVEAPGSIHLVDGISFRVDAGEVLGIVGESGSGKSMTVLSVMGLVPAPLRISGGRVLFAGEDLLRAGEARLRALRGDRIAVVFQDPLSALNPYLTIGDQLAEVLEAHRGTRRREALGRAAEMLERVGIPSPGERVRAYPHQLSGGMRQRVLIGMALLCDPALVLLDEPTSALDATVAAEILDLFRERREAHGTSFVLVTHDLGVLRGLADRALVMYAGRAMEEGPTPDLLGTPRHPYTLGLRRATPALDGAPLVAIPGLPPEPGQSPPGCPFHPRCAFAVERCREQAPEAREVGPRRIVRCHVEEIA